MKSWLDVADTLYSVSCQIIDCLKHFSIHSLSCYVLFNCPLYLETNAESRRTL